MTVGGNNVSTVYSGVLSGSGRLTKTGWGTLTLSGENDYLGTTTLKLGAINLGAAEDTGTPSGPLGANDDPGSILMEGGVLQYSSVNQYDYSNRFSTDTEEQYNVDTNGQTVTWSADLTSQYASLTKLGSGTLIVSGENTYWTTTIVAGSIYLDSAEESDTPSGPLGVGQIVFNGGVLSIRR